MKWAQFINNYQFYSRRSNDEVVCLVLLFSYVLPRHVLPDVYICSLRKKGVRLLLTDSKMYISGSIANSQRMLTEINKSSAIAKIRI